MPRQLRLLGYTPKDKPTPWIREAVADWNARFGERSAHFGKIGVSLKPLVQAHGWDAVRPAWQRYLREHPGRFCSPANFREHFALWSGGKALSDRDRLFVDLIKGGDDDGERGDL